MKRLGVAAVALAAVLSVPAFGQTLEENVGAGAPTGFIDNNLSYRYGPSFREPGISSPRHPGGVDIPKHILNFTHVDGGRMWSNFVTGDVLFSTSRDPANNSRNGAVEFYGIYRGDLSLNDVTRSRRFTMGSLLSDVSLQIGGDFNTKNTAFAPEKKLLVFGPDLHWNITGGFFSTAFQIAKEWNNNGITGRSVDFDPTWEFEAAWSVPLTFTRLPLTFNGFANVVGPKGRDGFNAPTKVEVLAEPRITLDVGALAFGKAQTVDAFVGYQYWLNKFGNDNRQVPGSLANTIYFGVRYHL